MRVLLTGATGFVGSAIEKNITDGAVYDLSVVVRREEYSFHPSVKKFLIGNIDATNDWRVVLKCVDVVIHSAARVHVMEDLASNPLSAFRETNTDGTLNLARQAAQVGVKRFIFISSIKVNGQFTKINLPYTELDLPRPADPYGVSKLEAEQGLLALAKKTGMEVVIIRPPLVYGPGVKANFLSMMRWLNKGVPLPLGALQNKRSFVALDNLVDLILTCVEHPGAANQVFLVSDGEDLSTPELLKRMAESMGKSVWLLPVPISWLKSGVALFGKRDVALRLFESLQLDISKAKRVLDWVPPVSVDNALKKTADDFFSR